MLTRDDGSPNVKYRGNDPLAYSQETSGYGIASRAIEKSTSLSKLIGLPSN
jgi:hypothetical protein